MVNISVNEFRANIHTLLLRVQNGEIISLRQQGTEIARLVPPDFAQNAAQREIENLRKTAVVEDVVSPIDVEWELTA